MLQCKAVFATEVDVEQLIRILFPFQRQIDDIPLIARVNLEKEQERGYQEWFSYENQFVIHVIEKLLPGGRYRCFNLQWHSYYTKAENEAKEQAICVLHEGFSIVK